MLGTTEIALLVGAAVLLFGVDKLPKLARSAGQAKKEFMVGQAEADVAAEKAREDAKKAAAASAAAGAAAAPASSNGTAAEGTAPAAGTTPAATPPHPN
jgi:sec-independent protein translocase protein TatA